MSIEFDEFDEVDIQHLIDSGLAWQLEGYYGRLCMDAIESGHAMLPPEPQSDYWGNRIPSRYEVEDGTPGSPGYFQSTQEDINNA
jgi:hypothetical protein